jgi:intracellular sulfur oxidation DsrE/DsrF family protein
MNRRNIFAIFGAAAALAPFGVRKAAAEGDKKPHRLAIHVDQNEPGVMNLALNNTMNMYEHYRERGEEVVVEIVAYSQGLHMLREDTSPVKAKIKELRAKAANTVFSACNNTMRAMEKAEGKRPPLIAEATIVPAGVVRLSELQEQGWSYVKP